MGRASGGASPGKTLPEVSRRLCVEIRVTQEAVRAAKQSWEEVEDLIKQKISTVLNCMVPSYVCLVVDKLVTGDRGLARAEIVTTKIERFADRSAAGQVDFRIGRISESRLFIVGELKSKLVKPIRGKRRS